MILEELNEMNIKPSIPDLPPEDGEELLSKIDKMARHQDYGQDADAFAHSFGYPEDRSYSADLEDYEIAPYTIDHSEVSKEIYRLKRKGLPDMQIAKSLEDKFGIPWEEMMYDLFTWQK